MSFNMGGFNLLPFNIASTIYIEVGTVSGLHFKMISQSQRSAEMGANKTNLKTGYSSGMSVTAQMGSQAAWDIQMQSYPIAEHVESYQTAVNAPVRQIHALVEITYTDPFSDLTLDVDAPAAAYNTRENDLIDGLNNAGNKWFGLDNNILDGSFAALPSNATRQQSVGWWSRTTSLGDGTLPAAVKVKLTFSARAIQSLSVAGDQALNSYPVNFTIKGLNSRGTEVISRSVVNNTTPHWYEAITPVLDVVMLELTITKINKSSQAVRLTEFFTSLRETYQDSEIVTLSLLEEIGYSSGSIPIGNISSNEVDIVLSNADRRFDVNNTNSLLYGYIKRNRQVKVSFGVLVDGIMEWRPMGTFWTTTWDIQKGMLTASLTARDRLDILRRTEFDISLVYQNYSIYELFRLILGHAGLGSDEYFIDPALQNIRIPYVWFDKITHREALQKLAEVGIIQVYCDKQGVIQIRKGLIPLNPEPTGVFDDDVNVIEATYPLAVSEQVNSITIDTVTWVKDTELTLLYESEAEMTIPTGTTQYEFKFSTTPFVSNAETIIQTKDGSAPLTLWNYTTYAWGVRFETRNTGVPQVWNKITIRGFTIKKQGSQTITVEDQLAITEDGRISQSIEHDFIQDSAYAKGLAESLLQTFKQSRYDVTLDNRGDPTMELGDLVQVVDSLDNQADQYLLARQQFQWDGTLSAVSEAKKL